MTRKTTKSPRQPVTASPQPATERKAMKVQRQPMASDTRLPFSERFPVAPTPPGVPQSAQTAMDSAMQPAYEYVADFGFFGDDVAWLGFPLLAALTQRPEYRVISEVFATEMTRKGFELTYSGEDETEAEAKLAELEKACAQFKVIDHLRVASEHDGFYGGGHIYIDVCDYNDLDELKTPLVLASSKIPKGGLNGFKNIEPIWCYPANYNSSDPLAPFYFQPQQWYVNSKTVHKSRLLTLITREVPDILKASYSFRGLSLSQVARPYVDNWLRTRQSVSDLIHSFSIISIASNLQAQVQDGEGWDNIYARVDQMNMLRDNRGAFVLDKDTEKMESIAVPLGTLDALQAQSQEHMSAVAQIPLVKLLGIQPAGLNASGDSEIRTFYDTVHARQEAIFAEPLRIMLQCIQLHLWGEIDPYIGHKFLPLWQLDEAAQAAVRKTDADTNAVYVQEGVLSPEDVRGMLIADKDSPYAGLDPDDLPEPPDDMGEISTGGGEAKGEPSSVQRGGA